MWEMQRLPQKHSRNKHGAFLMRPRSNQGADLWMQLRFRTVSCGLSISNLKPYPFPADVGMVVLLLNKAELYTGTADDLLRGRLYFGPRGRDANLRTEAKDLDNVLKTWWGTFRRLSSYEFECLDALSLPASAVDLVSEVVSLRTPPTNGNPLKDFLLAQRW